MDCRLPADKVLFMVSAIGNSDGTMDFSMEAPDVFETEAEAIQCAKDDEHGCEFVIYRITPIWFRKRRMIMQKVKP
jgi:hypothetical protein